MGRPIVVNSKKHRNGKAPVHVLLEPETRRQVAELCVARGETLTAAFETALRRYIAEEAKAALREPATVRD